MRVKIFAMLCRGELVVKLPEDAVDALVARGEGARFEPWRNGRKMREWVTIPAGRLDEWPDLADAALIFVRSRASR